MVHASVHAVVDTDTHACPMTGTASAAGMPLQGRPSHGAANHAAGLGKGGGCALALDDGPVAELSALDLDGSRAQCAAPIKSTASVQLAARKRRPAPPPPTAASPSPSPAASPAPSPRPSPRPSPTPSRPAPPPPTAGPLPQRRYLNGLGDSTGVPDRQCRVPSPSPAAQAGPVGQAALPGAGEAPGQRPGLPPAPHPGASPDTPPLQQQQQRHMTTMDIQPATPYGAALAPPRPYTSVNLTLRQPGEQAQPPMGSSLTYSSFSCDPRGYQAQLQIQFGPNGPSVSAMRTRGPQAAGPQGLHAPQGAQAAGGVAAPPPAVRRAPPRPPAPSMAPLAEEPGPAATADTAPLRIASASREELERVVEAMGAADLSPEMREHLLRQLERRALLETELHKERAKLQLMQREVAEMERDLQRRTALARPRAPPALPVMQKVQKLRLEIQSLQDECTRMAHEVDAKTPQNRIEEGNNERGWTCQTCTFHNHYLLEACETCDVPRMHLGSDNDSGPRGPPSPRPRPSQPPGLHALSLPGFPPAGSGVLPSLATPALDAALAPLALAPLAPLPPNPTAVCVPNMLFPSPGHEE